MKRTTRALLTLCLALLLGLPACGYRLVGSRGEPVKLNVELAKFDDGSREPLFGPMLLREIKRKGMERSDLVSSSDGLGLEISVRKLVETPRAFNRTEVPAEYVLTVSADLKLTRGGMKVWENRDLSGRREFAAGHHINGTRENRNRALEALARDVASDLMRRVSVAVSTLPAGEGNMKGSGGAKGE